MGGTSSSSEFEGTFSDDVVEKAVDAGADGALTDAWISTCPFLGLGSNMVVDVVDGVGKVVWAAVVTEVELVFADVEGVTVVVVRALVLLAVGVGVTVELAVEEVGCVSVSPRNFFFNQTVERSMNEVSGSGTRVYGVVKQIKYLTDG